MSKTCMLPWLHFFVASTGKITPCCIYDQSFTSIVDASTPEEIINSPAFKELRSNMINGKEDLGCMRCYNEERLGMFSDRLRHNDAWKEHAALVDKTNPDGSIDDFKLKFLDIRWENTCNLRCRTCSPDLSSRISTDYFKLKWINDPIKITKLDALYNYIIENISDVEEFYFVGGEPLLMANHYGILDALIEKKNFDARLTYSTNLTVLSYKNKNVLDYWKQLTNLLVMVSLDAMDERAEYLRSGTNWNELLANILTVKSAIPHVQLKIASVFSVYNALHLPDLQQFLLEEGLVTPDQLEINVAYGQKFCPRAISPAGKKLVKEKAEAFLQWAKANNYYSENLQAQWDRCLVYLFSEDLDLANEIKSFNAALDELRNEDLLTAFPEMIDLVA